MEPVTAPQPRFRALAHHARRAATLLAFLAVAAGGCTSAVPVAYVGRPVSSVSGRPSEAAATDADDGARIVANVPGSARVRDLTIDSPALGRAAHVRLLLPSAFDLEPARRWPVLYLLHGASEPVSYRSWTLFTDVEALTEPTDLLVVMPEAGTYGYYSDWWNGGAGGPPAWETFHLVELRQLIERNFRAGDRRAIAGLSMGGFGAMSYAARHPGMFVAAAAFSGVLDTAQQPQMDPDLWGDKQAQASIWQAHNPTALADRLRGLTLFVSYGDGRPGPLDPPGSARDSLEARLNRQSRAFVGRLHELGIPVTVDAYGAGTHSWPYWQRSLHEALPLILRALGEG